MSKQNVLLVLSFLTFILALIFYAGYDSYFSVLLSYKSIEAQVNGTDTSLMIAKLAQSGAIKTYGTVILSGISVLLAVIGVSTVKKNNK